MTAYEIYNLMNLERQAAHADVLNAIRNGNEDDIAAAREAYLSALNAWRIAHRAWMTEVDAMLERGRALLAEPIPQ